MHIYTCINAYHTYIHNHKRRHDLCHSSIDHCPHNNYEARMPPFSRGLRISLLPILMVAPAVSLNGDAMHPPRNSSRPGSYSDARKSNQATAVPVDPTSTPSFNRRAFLGLGAVLTNVGILNGGPNAASALQERNEVLCGTGFFTNIALYKCTEIGDISDEGKSRPLSTTEEGSMQSLMDKMGMDLSVLDEEANKKRT